MSLTTHRHSWVSRYSLPAVFLIALIVVLTYPALYPPQPRIIALLNDTSGDYKGIGESVRLGAQYAADNLPPLPDGTRLTVRPADDSGIPSKAQKKALAAAADADTLAVIGHSTSATTEAALQIYGPLNLPLLMPVATNPDLTSSAKSGWATVFRLVPNDEIQASTIADFCQTKLKARRVAVLYDDSRYGDYLSNAIERALIQRRVTVPPNLIVEKHLRGRTNYGPLVEHVVHYAPDVVVFAGYYGEAGPLIKEFRAPQYKFDRPVILTDGCFPKALFSGIGTEAGKIYATFLAPDWSSYPKARSLVAYIKQGGADEDSYAPFAYDSVELIYAAAKRVLEEQKPLSRTSLLRALQANRESQTPSLIAGPYRFNAAGDNQEGRNYVYRLSNQLPYRWEFLE